jgi:subtilase family serine protease
MGQRTLAALVVAVIAVAATGGGLVAQEPATPAPAAAGQGPRRVARPASIVRAGRHDQSPALRDLVPMLPRAERDTHAPLPIRQAAKRPHLPDPAIQTTLAATAVPAPFLNFEGVGNVDAVLPPDTNGDVGPNHYVQWVNKTFALYSKTGSLLYGPAAGNTIWSGFGGPCETQNDGDPIVLYDHLADRWLFSQFALPNNFLGLLFAPFYQCIAVSQTADPTGAYYRYQYEFSKLNDYPKFGVWADGYYMAVNLYAPITLQFAGQGVAAFDRAAMLGGQPASMVYFDLASVDPNLGGMLPSDLDGPPPPAGSPNFFAQIDDDAGGYAPDQIQIWRFHADWSSPAQSSFTGPFALPVASFDGNLCDSARACIPQPGTTARLDAMSDRLMYRLQYRNFGSHETLVVNHTVDVDGTDHAGVRWYEIRNPGGTPVLHQQGTFAPDANHRWMASAAMDAGGSIALAYNVSSSLVSPSIRYAARLASDPPGVLAQGEADLIVGSGSQTHSSSRWGDYSMLAVDPVDGCTFWATTMYYGATSLAGWQTRVGAFRLPGCGGSGTPPAPPANLAAIASSANRINLSWSDQSSDELAFAIERCTGTAPACTGSAAFGQIAQVGAGVATYADITAQGSTTYAYRVRAVNFGGYSEYSNVAEATTPAAPPPPTVTVSASTPTATEAGPANGVFTISRETPRDTPLAVVFSISGTAVQGTDYQTIPTTATIPADAASVDVLVRPINDTTIEPSESVILTLSPSSNYAIGSPASETVTIVSDDLSIDLTVASLTPPSTASAGATIQVNDGTRNQGTDEAGASITSFYLSSNSVLDGADTPIGTREVPALPAGTTHTGSSSLTIPANFAAGSYWLFAKADGPGALGETNENNNTRSAIIRIGPDLIVSALSAPANAGAGRTIVVSDTTKNQGSGAAGGSVTRFYLSTNFTLDAADETLQSHAVNALDSNATHTVSTNVTIPAGTGSGLFYLIAVTDVGNDVLESFENNNTKYVTIRVGADLQISALTMPSRAAVGSTISVTDTTKNIGGGAAGASTTAFYLSANTTLDAGDHRLAQTRAVGPLDAGAQSVGTTMVTLPASFGPGLWYLLANADDSAQVAESQESNNVRFATLHLGPDLMVWTATAPATAVAGTTITVSDTVKNLGLDTAPPSVNRYYLSLNTTLDAGDIPLDASRNVPALGYNASHSGSVVVTIPTELSGRYYILIVADGTGVVVESSETNNVQNRSVTINP